MNRLDPDLHHLGDALHASTSNDLAREERAAGAADARPGARALPRVLAGGTLGLAGVGAALAVALGGGATAAPAFAVTPQGNGSVLVTINQQESVPQAAAKLVAMDNEDLEVRFAPGAATVSGPVTCTPAAGLTAPPVKVLLETTGTEVIAAGNTGAGTWHVASCGTWAPGTTPPASTGEVLIATPLPASPAGSTAPVGNSGLSGNSGSGPATTRLAASPAG